MKYSIIIFASIIIGMSVSASGGNYEQMKPKVVQEIVQASEEVEDSSLLIPLVTGSGVLASVALGILIGKKKKK